MHSVLLVQMSFKVQMKASGRLRCKRSSPLLQSRSMDSANPSQPSMPQLQGKEMPLCPRDVNYSIFRKGSFLTCQHLLR